MTRTGSKIHRPVTHFRILPVTAALLLGACASVPPPTRGMSQAQADLQAAITAGAAMYAPLELGSAKAKLSKADAAMQAQEYADAANLAEESEANSTLARVKAQLGKAHEQINQATAENARLRQQLLNDNTTPSASAQSGDQP